LCEASVATTKVIKFAGGHAGGQIEALALLKSLLIWAGVFRAIDAAHVALARGTIGTHRWAIRTTFGTGSAVACAGGVVRGTSPTSESERGCESKKYFCSIELHDDSFHIASG